MLVTYVLLIASIFGFNDRFLRERGMASNPKMEYQVFLCIFQKNSATYGYLRFEGNGKKAIPKGIFPFPSNLR
jgi:polyphosphate kinase